MLARQAANAASPHHLLVVEVVAIVVRTDARILPLDHVPVLPESLKIDENPDLQRNLFTSFQQS